MTEPSPSPNERRLRPWAAFLAGLCAVAVGLGYLYVGRPRLALRLLISIVAVMGVLSGCRFIVTPFGYYLALIVGVAAVLVGTIHPALIARARRTAPRNWYNRGWIYVALWLLPSVCIALAGGFDAFREQAMGFGTFKAVSLSMSPTLEPNDFFMVDAWQYRQRPPAVGDVVVYEAPGKPQVRYVKRIVGVPGDVLEIRDSVVYRNGTALREPYLHAPTDQRPYGRDHPSVRLARDEYFVLGDYRDNSLDSRELGPLPRAAFVGPVKFVWFSGGSGAKPPGAYPRVVE